MATDVGTGATITYSSGYFAEITNITWDGISREAIDTTYMGSTTARTFMPGDLYDPGELTVELNFEESDELPPITSTAETVTITLPDATTSSAVWTAAGYMTGFSWTAPVEEKQTATATLKMTGQIGATTAA